MTLQNHGLHAHTEHAHKHAHPGEYDAAKHGLVSGTDRAVTDPVCGMKIDPESAAGSEEYEGSKYFFCSAHCQARFKADPQRFVPRTGSPAEQPVRAAAKYTCPM